jgi:hypothetical protein
MESPEGWDLLTSSIAVHDLEKPFFIWAFLVVQGLVRDLPGDRDTFCRIVQYERASDITGPSKAWRIASSLRDAGISLPISKIPDPNADIAMQRRQLLRQWNASLD